MTNFNFNNTPDLEYWQGIRYLTDNYYIICGTNKNKQGIFYIGDLLTVNSENTYLVQYPNAVTTSIYGPDYLGDATYRLVGSYQNENDGNIYGLFYHGSLTNLSNSTHFKTINLGYSYTFVHSTMENILVGNYDQTNLGPISAFLMIIDNGKVINISYPGTKSNTVYGIWYDGYGMYTLCGGYSYLEVNVNQVYIGNIIKPFGYAYLVNYNINTNEFTNWTTLFYPYLKKDILSHFEGISRSSPTTYQLAADTIHLGKIITSYVEVKKDSENKFILNKWIDFNYPLPGIIESSSNSVAPNVIVGTYVDEENSSLAFQLQLE